jgi:hypothetical protein
MRRDGLAAALPWLVFGAVELWFAQQGFVTPTAAQVATELVIWPVIGLGLARLAPEGWLRSPLWAAVLPFAWAWFLLGPRGAVGLVHLVGTGVLAAGLVWRVERERPVGVLPGVVLAALAAVALRWVVLSGASDGKQDDRQSSVARDARAEVLRELTAPLQPLPARDGDGPPLVLITVDTLRADHGERMEVYRRLAARGTAFRAASSTSSWTVPAMASVLTGVMPAQHGAGVDAAGQLQGIDGEVPTLAEVLTGEGYRTAAFATNAWLTTGLGFPRGFDVYWHADEDFHHLLAAAGFPKGPKPRDAERVVGRAIDWLETAPEGGWLLWVHLIDPHLPYAHPEGRLEAGLSDERLRAGMRLSPEVEAKVKAAYAHEVDHADAWLGRLLDALEARGVLERGVVVLTADHGEELWDHGATGHGHSHHREVVQVPLVIAGAGVAHAERSELVSLLDVPTTLAAVAGTSIGEGVDLRGPLDSGRRVAAHGNAYFHPMRSAWGPERRALVLDARPDAPMRCFDPVSDPTEQAPLPCGDDGVSRLARETAPPRARAGEAALPAEALKALGYATE